MVFQEIFNDDYIKILFDKQTRILEVLAKPKSIELDDGDLKTENILIVNFLRELKPKYLVANNRDFGGIYSVDIQEWISDLFVNVFIEVGIEKTAQIKPKELVSFLSSDQVIDRVKEKDTLPFEIKSFDKVEEAIDWFLN